MDELGEKIRYYRKRVGLTQEQLADRLNVSLETVSKWEDNLSCPDISVLPELADILGITVDELLGREGPAQERVAEAELVNEGSKGVRVSVTLRDGVFFALYILCAGIVMLVNHLLHFDVGNWTVLWTLALVFFGISRQKKRFSAFALVISLAGLYFLLSHYSTLRLPLTWGIVLPVVFVIWGVSLLIDVFRDRRHRS